MDKSPRLGQGIALVLLANLLFSFVDTSTKWLLGAGLLVFQLAFMRYAVHFAITAVQRILQGKPASKLPRDIAVLVFLRSFCLVSATLVNFFALAHLSLTVTSAMLYLSPIFICLFSYALLDEAITRHHWFSVMLGFLGAMLILWPFGEPINWYAVLMLYPAIGMALYQVLTRKLTGAVTPGVLQFYTGALGTCALAPFALVYWVPPAMPFDWLLLCALGAFAWAGHEALTRAFAHAPASTLAPFGYSFIIYLTLAGFVVFSELPTLNVVLGAVLIFVGGMYAWRYSRP